MATKDCDVVIVGGGPAGLSAAINGASEGLKVLLIDAAISLGGQAKESARIENYPMPSGNSNGVSGAQLAAGFITQAERFCTDLLTPMRAVRLETDGEHRVIITDDFQQFAARAVILSQGLSYRRHEARGLAAFMGRGIHYGFPPSLTGLKGCTIVVVGAANSAGQAILELAIKIRKVRIKVLARGPVERSMSTYLIDRIRATENYGTPDATVEIIEGAELLSVEGDRARMREVTYKTATGRNSIPADFVLFYIGAVPQTAWLSRTIVLDEKRFIPTGKDLPPVESYWPRPRLPFETSVMGVFASGDVRLNSVKRIVNAVGEGGATLQMVHTHLAGSGN
jgi:thioredoxin reductase (NADPH)